MFEVVEETSVPLTVLEELTVEVDSEGPTVLVKVIMVP